MRNMFAIMAASMGLIGHNLQMAAALPFAGHHMGRTRYGFGGRPPRSKYMPHQGKREIARRLARAARASA